MKIAVKKLDGKAVVPTRGSRYAAGYDLYACLGKEAVILPGGTLKIPTGLAMALPTGYAGFVFARSGIATKRGLVPANCVGVIDSDYRGDVIVALYNNSSEPQTVLPNERIAQLIVLQINELEFENTEFLINTDRGDGGFGSTEK